MNRGQEGLLPRTTTLADESYLDFVESFRRFNFSTMYPSFFEAGSEVVSRELGPEGDRAPLEDIQRVINTVPVARSWQRMMRSHQEMMWRRTRASFERDEADHLKSLDDAAARGPATLHVDPDFVVPEYARREIHLQPGGYTDDPLGGIVFHYGTKCFYQGYNDQDQHHQEFTDALKVPADGICARILDVGCSIGQCTRQLKTRFPDAEVWGLDVGLPLVRYAHKIACDQDVAVHYKQGLAEATGFEDDSFDAVLSYILFHELPVEIIEQVIPEMFRILRPGGTFTIFEFPNMPSDNLPAAQRFLIDYDSRNNCEPYSQAFVEFDFHGLIERSGFQLEPGQPCSNDFLQSLVLTKPA
ncbi:MAG: methyltransferase domain-containing protein [Pseudomonadota bacterium]